MKEQSHKDEMSKALRGDFERLRDRGVATTLARQHAQPTPDEPESVEEFEPGAEPVTQPVTDTPVAEAEEPRGGWLGRLLGR